MITILMPIKNGIEFIDESVQSILAQTYTDWELIIGINGHAEDSDVHNRAKPYASQSNRVNQIRVVVLPSACTGKSAALNEMLTMCSPKSEWISLLDVDDKWLPTKLESQIPYMSKFDVIGTRCSYFGDSTITFQLPVGDITTFNFLSDNPIINSSCLIRKELCSWNTESQTHGIEDYDIWLRLWKQGCTFFNVETILVLHRIHKESAFNSKGNNLLVDALRQKYK